MARSRLKLFYIRIPGASRDPPRSARAVARWTPAFAGDAVGGGRVERLNHPSSPASLSPQPIGIPGESRDPPRSARAVPRWTPAFAGDSVGGSRVERLDHRHCRHGSALTNMHHSGESENPGG